MNKDSWSAQHQTHPPFPRRPVSFWIIGKPLSGKTTLALALAKKLGVIHITPTLLGSYVRTHDSIQSKIRGALPPEQDQKAPKDQEQPQDAAMARIEQTINALVSGQPIPANELLLVLQKRLEEEDAKFRGESCYSCI